MLHCDYVGGLGSAPGGVAVVARVAAHLGVSLAGARTSESCPFWILNSTLIWPLMTISRQRSRQSQQLPNWSPPRHSPWTLQNANQTLSHPPTSLQACPLQSLPITQYRDQGPLMAHKALMFWFPHLSVTLPLTLSHTSPLTLLPPTTQPLHTLCLGNSKATIKS